MTVGVRTLPTAARLTSLQVYSEWKDRSKIVTSQIVFILSNYLTAAAAIGATIDDVKLFVKRVDKVLGKMEEDGENREVLSRKTKELMM